MIGAFIGLACGFVGGLVVAGWSRNGLWPDVWAFFMVVLMVIGGAIGGLNWALSSAEVESGQIVFPSAQPAMQAQP